MSTPINAAPASTMHAIASDVTIVPKAAELVARRLRGEIVRGDTPVGEPLASEKELMERFGVSRPTLRAALRILETQSLVEVRRGSRGGTWVCEPSIDVTARRAGAFLQYHRATVDDVHRARALVEPPSVALLAVRRDPEQLAKLRATLDDEAAALEDMALVRTIGQRFHAEIVELAGNQTLIVFSSMLQEIIDIQTARAQVHRRERGIERAAPTMHAEHIRTLELIAAGAADEAEQHWRAHLEHVRERVAAEGDDNLDIVS
jgi:DNA-binding FadR family transcriptional regulator